MPGDYVSRSVRLVIGNRARGRLRLSLRGAMRQLSRLYGGRPEGVRLKRFRTLPLHVLPDDRVFLTQRISRALGGVDASGERVVVEFLLPERLHIYDVFLAGSNARYEEGRPVIRGASGVGVLFRVEWRTRGQPRPTLELINSRLRSYGPVRTWLNGMRGTLLDEPVTGYAARPPDPGTPKGRRWLMQVLRKDKRRAEIEIQQAHGSVIFHTPLFTTFRVQSHGVDVEGATRTSPGIGAFTGVTFFTIRGTGATP